MFLFKHIDKIDDEHQTLHTIYEADYVKLGTYEYLWHKDESKWPDYMSVDDSGDKDLKEAFVHSLQADVIHNVIENRGCQPHYHYRFDDNDKFWQLSYVLLYTKGQEYPDLIIYNGPAYLMNSDGKTIENRTVAV